MPSKYAKASLPKSKEVSFVLREVPFALPDPAGDVEEYVVILKESAPFDYVSVGGLSIHKNTLPSEYSLVENQGKVFAPTIMVRELAPNQLKALKDECAKRKVRIPAKLVSDEEGKEEYSKAFDAIIGDYLHIEPKRTFNPMLVHAANPKEEEVNKDNLMAYQNKKKDK